MPSMETQGLEVEWGRVKKKRVCPLEGLGMGL